MQARTWLYMGRLGHCIACAPGRRPAISDISAASTTTAAFLYTFSTFCEI